MESCVQYFQNLVDIDWITITCSNPRIYEEIMYQCEERDWLGLQFYMKSHVEKFYHWDFPKIERISKVCITQYQEYNQNLLQICFMGKSAATLIAYMMHDPHFLIGLKLNITRIDLKYNFPEVYKEGLEYFNIDNFCEEQRVFDKQKGKRREIQGINKAHGFLIQIDSRTNPYFSRISFKDKFLYYELELKKRAAKSTSIYILYRNWLGFYVFLYKSFINEARFIVPHDITQSLCDYALSEEKYLEESLLFLKNAKLRLKQKLFCKHKFVSENLSRNDSFANNQIVLTKNFLEYIYEYSLDYSVKCMILLYFEYALKPIDTHYPLEQDRKEIFSLSPYDGDQERLFNVSEVTVDFQLNCLCASLDVQNTKVNKEKNVNSIINLAFTGQTFNTTTFEFIAQVPFLTRCGFFKNNEDQKIFSYSLHPNLVSQNQNFSILVSEDFLLLFDRFIKKHFKVTQTSPYSYKILAYILLELTRGECVLFEEEIFKKSTRVKKREKVGLYYFYILEFIKKEKIIKNWTFGNSYSWKKTICKKTFLNYWSCKKDKNKIWILF